jgi:hypothetical protein
MIRNGRFALPVVFDEPAVDAVEACVPEELDDDFDEPHAPRASTSTATAATAPTP